MSKNRGGLTMERETTLKEQMEIAQLRFGMIARVIQGTFTDVSIAAYCRRVAQTPVKLPDGRTLQYKPKTIEKWVNTYNQGGMDVGGAISALHGYSEGNPRKIDNLMTDALTIGAQQEKTSIDAEVILAAANNQSLT